MAPWVTEKENQHRREDDGAAEVAHPPRHPDRAVILPIRKTAQRETGDADRGADHGTDRQGEREPKHVVGMIESANAVGDLLQEPHAHHRLERVSNRDPERGEDIARSEDVDEKRADKKPGPKPKAEKQQRRHRDPGRRPDWRRARI